MIKTFYPGPTYAFLHHDDIYRAYGELGIRLSVLREDIRKKRSAMLKDKTKYMYYKMLLENLCCQFDTWVTEGLKAGSIEIITAQVAVEDPSLEVSIEEKTRSVA